MYCSMAMNGVPNLLAPSKCLRADEVITPNKISRPETPHLFWQSVNILRSRLNK